MENKKEITEIPEDLELEILNEEQKRYRFYENNAIATIKQLKDSVKLQEELLEFFKRRVEEEKDDPTI